MAALCSVCLAEDLADRATREFLAKDYVAAERDFREMTKADPGSFFAQAYLGHSLFRQKRFAEAIAPYEKALELEHGGKKLSQKDHRILVDQLVMSYGMGGQIKKLYPVLDQAIKADPDYALNYYNLACAYGEEGNKAKMLANLDLAFHHKDHLIEGEKMPDPRKDSSFKKFVADPDFVSLMKKLEI